MLNGLKHLIVRTIDRISVSIIGKNRALSILLNPIYPSLWGRRELLKSRGVKLGANVFIDFFVWIEGGLPQYVEIEDCVVLAAHAKILAHDSSLNNMFDIPIKAKITRLQKNCYIGTGAIVMPGITVGEQSIVGAGAVVTSDVPPLTVVGGNPARILMTVDELIEKYQKDRLVYPEYYIERKSSYRLKIDEGGKVVNE